MKGARMLVVSLRGVNFRFWSHLGSSGQNTITFGRKGLFQGCTRRQEFKQYGKLEIYDNGVLVWPPVGDSLGSSHTNIGLLWGFDFNFRRGKINSTFPLDPPPLMEHAEKQIFFHLWSIFITFEGFITNICEERE